MQHNPQSLRVLCLEFCLKNFESTLCRKNVSTGFFELREDIVLPLSLSTDLLETYKERKGVLDNKFLNIFRDARRTSLGKLDLSNSDVTNGMLSDLCEHPLNELNISFCRRLRTGFVHAVNKTTKTLQVLNVDQLTSEDFYTEFYRIRAEPRPHEETPSYGHDYVFNLPNLRALTLTDMRCYGGGIEELVATILNPLKKLEHLDLSRCDISNVKYMDCLVDLAPTLKSLVLHNVRFPNLDEVFVIISQLTNLRHLDISCDSRDHRDDAGDQLKHLLTSLPHLESLDISGTNLAGTGFETPVSACGDSPCPIPALAGRHLKFLGLFGCPHSPYERQNLPADQVTGKANWKQIACAVTTYVDRPSICLKSLDLLYQLMRNEDEEVSSEAQLALSAAAVTAMERHPKDVNIQNSGSASFYFFTRQEDNETRPVYPKKFMERLIRCVLHAVSRFMNDKTIIFNCCFTLCQLDIPADIQFEYEYTVQVLVALLLRPGVDDLVLRICAFLINKLSCHVTGAEKALIGAVGGIQALTELISDRLLTETSDEVMTMSWSALWNVTDETSLNCQRFMDSDGMDLFLNCLQTFPEDDDLRRNMMGLMGNIAEVKELRPQLMQTQFVEEFSNLLESTRDGIEVSYNAAGVLSHLLSDGADAWVIDHPKRSDVTTRIVAAIERWDLSSSRNINYRSFSPILKLASRYDVPEAQYWSVWALCNLIKVSPEKYCPLLHRQGGFSLVEQISQHETVKESVKILAKMIIEQHLVYEAMLGQSCPLNVAPYS